MLLADPSPKKLKPKAERLADFKRLAGFAVSNESHWILVAEAEGVLIGLAYVMVGRDPGCLDLKGRFSELYIREGYRPAYGVVKELRRAGLLVLKDQGVDLLILARPKGRKGGRPRHARPLGRLYYVLGTDLSILS